MRRCALLSEFPCLSWQNNKTRTNRKEKQQQQQTTKAFIPNIWSKLYNLKKESRRIDHMDNSFPFIHIK